jgi:hypothetical protein
MWEDNMPSKWQEQRIECVGGLEVTKNHMVMSSFNPGVATTLTNYEVSSSGGYARILGYEEFNDDYPEPGVGTCEGAVLGIFYYTDSSGQTDYYAVRKNTSGTTYSMWKYDPGNAWTSVTLPATRNTSDSGRNIVRLRWTLYNDGSNNYLIIVDGVNPALIFDGTNWLEMTSSNSGTTASPGGNQILSYPNYISVFKEHLFLARCDGCAKALVCHSAPFEPFNFVNADGAGQLQPGFDVEQIYPFRNTLYIFGSGQIKAVVEESSAFVINDVTTNIGLCAPDSVQELGESIVFLSQDGFRPIAATERIGDIEISPLTDLVRPLLISIVDTYDKNAINTILLRRKNQLRMSYGGAADGTESNEFGYILGIRRNRDGSTTYESGQLFQLNFWCGMSEVIDGSEVTLHGGLDGKVYIQERGNSFNGNPIYSSFSGPFLDQGAAFLRKTYKKIKFFLRLDYSAGSSSTQDFYVGVKNDWDDPDIINPSDFTISSGQGNIQYDAGYTYGGGGKYGGNNPTIIELSIEGSGESIKPNLVTTGITPRHILFGYIIVFDGQGVN